MKEQSQIDEMRAAVRGDRERAERARQRSSENVLGLLERPTGNAAPARQPEPQRRGFLSRLLGR